MRNWMRSMFSNRMLRLFRRSDRMSMNWRNTTMLTSVLLAAGAAIFGLSRAKNR